MIDWQRILKPADIIVSKGSMIDSYLIRQYENGEYSHVCLYITNKKIVEATYPFFEEDKRDGVMISPIEKYQNRSLMVLRCLDLNSFQKALIMRWAVDRTGEKFSHKKMLAMLLPFMQNRKEDGWFCSELICFAYKMAGINLLPGTRGGFMGVNDFPKSPYLTPVILKV